MSMRSLILAVTILGCFLITNSSARAFVVDDPLCDLAVTKTGPQQATPNADLTYTITVTNNGPDPATNAQVTDQLDPSLSFVSIGPPSGWTCTTPPVGTTGNIVCSNPSYLPGTVDNFTIVTHSSPTAPTNNFITNKAFVSTGTFDTNEENDSGSATTLISTASGMTNVGIQKFADTESALAGTAITFTIVLNNSDPAQNVQLKDPLPGGMTFVSIAAPNGWNCQTPTPGITGTVTCAIASLASVTDQQFTLVAKIPSDAVSGTTFTNIASVSADTYDSNSEDDSAAAAVTVAPGYTITAVSGNNQTTPINTPFQSTLQALVKDDAGNPAPGITVTFQAPASGPSGNFASTTTHNESVATDANGIATSSILTATGAAGAPYNVTATANFQTINFSLTNLKGSQTINFPALPPKTYGDPPLTLVASASSGLNVSFNIVSGPGTLSGSSLTILAVGTITIRAQQPGDTNYLAAAPVDQAITVLKASPSGNITSAKNPSDFNEPVTFSAIVTGKSGALAPSGTIQFTDGSANLNAPVTCTAIGNACAGDTSTSQLTPGNHDIGFRYSGDSNYAPFFRSLAGGQLVKSPPPISISDVSNSEGDSATTKFDFLISLSAASSLPVTVDFATQDGTATLIDHDYVESHGTITFNPGEKTKIVTILVNGDLNREPNETFFVNLNNAVNGTILRSQGTGLILNDDTLDPPQIILEQSGPTPNQAAAVDSILLLRDPLPVKSAATWLDLGADRNTRVIIFSSNLQLAQGELPSAVLISLIDATGASHDVPAEDVRAVPNLSAITQVTFRLPDDLPAGPCAVTIKFHSLFSNQAVIRIK